MPDLNELLELRPPRREPPPVSADGWHRIEVKAEAPEIAEVWIYDTIGSSFFDEGTDAKSFARKLQALDVDEILLHINSPGGDAFDGFAIYNTLRDHKASVTVVVDGLAASAASFVAQAGDVVRMNRGSQMMIHDASGVVIGNAGDMADFAATLNKVSDGIAEIYASRAGGTIAEWREAMGVESWYTAQEAVDAGLADEVAAKPADARNAFDLSVFNYAGRDQAPEPVVNRPAPKPPETPPASPVTPAEAARRIHAASVKTPDATQAAGRPQNTEGAAEMQFTDEERTALRARYGLPEGADDDAIKAALLAPPTPTEGGGTSDSAPGSTPDPATPKPAPHSAGTMMIDTSAWAEREERIKNLEAKAAKQAREERDKIIAQAVADGKFAPARAPHWVRLWDADPEGTRQVIESLARNVIPTAELGYAGDDVDGIDDEFKHLFPPVPSQKGA